MHVDARATPTQTLGVLLLKVYSPTGAPVTTEITNIEMTPQWVSSWDDFVGPDITILDDDGFLPDSFATWGYGDSEGGGFQSESFVNILNFFIRVPDEDGAVICVDSVDDGSGTSWYFSGSGAPEIIGSNGDISAGGTSPSAYCFSAYTVTCEHITFSQIPDTVQTSYCTPIEFQVTASDTLQPAQALTYFVTNSGAGVATVDSAGNVSFTPDPSDVNTVVEIIIEPAYASGCCYGAPERTYVSVTNSAPSAICPAPQTVTVGVTDTTAAAGLTDPDECDTWSWSLLSATPAPPIPFSIISSTGAVVCDLPDTEEYTEPFVVCVEVNDGTSVDTCCYDINPSSCATCTCCDTPGDADNGGAMTIGDVTFLIARIFSGGPAPVCCEEGDADGSGAITIGDVTYLIARIFSGGPAPVCGPAGMLCGTN
jgi:hypothetical protein